MASPDTYKRRPVSIYIVKREAIDIKRRTHRRRTAPTLTPKLSKIIKALKTAKTGKTIKRLRNYRLPRGIRPLRRLRLRAKVLNVATAVLVSLILIVIVNMVFNGAPAKKNIAPADVSAFRIPPASLTALWDLSEKYGLDFTELLTVYALDNDFFPERSAAVPTTAEIEKQYILNYDELKTRYPETLYGEYYQLLGDLFTNNAVFPIPPDYTADSFMYGDSFGTKKYDDETQYTGTDVFDRENVSGRIPIVTVSGGIAQDCGWSEADGYHVTVKSASGVSYVYANLDGESVSLTPGSSLAAGQSLGAMGDSAHVKKEGDAANRPVHLQIKIKVETALADGDFWINPYPVLRWIEYKAAPTIDFADKM